MGACQIDPLTHRSLARRSDHRSLYGKMQNTTGFEGQYGQTDRQTETDRQRTDRQTEKQKGKGKQESNRQQKTRFWSQYRHHRRKCAYAGSNVAKNLLRRWNCLGEIPHTWNLGQYGMCGGKCAYAGPNQAENRYRRWICLRGTSRNTEFWPVRARARARESSLATVGWETAHFSRAERRPACQHGLCGLMDKAPPS